MRTQLRRPIGLAVLLLFGLAVGLLFERTILEQPPASASTVHWTRWSRYDTASYVVSTLNLVSRGSPFTFADHLRRHHAIRRLVVYVDRNRTDLYFVKLLGPHGRNVGVLAYQLGWNRPRVVTALAFATRARRAPPAIVQAYRSDQLMRLEAFHSSLPA